MSIPIPPDHLSSAHALVKALKSSTETDKLQVARQALLADFYLPNKHTIIREWILDTWSKIKPDSILDPAYHELLLSLPLQPIDVSPLLLSYMRQANSSMDHSIACQTFRALHQSPVKPESWAEVWSALVHHPWTDIYDFLIKDWCPEQSPESRKKVATLILPSVTTFALTRQQSPWLQQNDGLIGTILPHPDIYSLLLQQLSTSEAVDLVPALFHHYTNLVVRDRYRLFTQPSSSRTSLDVFISDRIRQVVLQSLNLALSLLSNRWNLRALVWSHVVEWGGYLETDPGWYKAVEEEAQKAKMLLSDSSARQSALEILALLETLDHQATRIQPEVIGWCIASPPNLYHESDSILSALAKYHQLTRSMQDYVDLVTESCDLLLSASDSFKACRAAYELIISGPLFGTVGRRSLQLGKDGPAAARSVLSPPQKATKRKIEDSSIEAAKMGIRSRIASLLLNVGHHPEVVQQTLDRIKPQTHISSSKTRLLWAADIYLAAYLRLAAFAPMSELPELESLERNDTAIDETVVELALFALRQTNRPPLSRIMSNHLSRIIHNPSDSLIWPLARDYRLFATILQQLDERSRVQLLLSVCSMLDSSVFSADLIEIPEIRDSVDHAVVSAVTIPRVSQILPLATPSVQETFLRRVFQSVPTDYDLEFLAWTRHCLATPRFNFLVVEKDTFKNLICFGFLAEAQELVKTAVELSVRFSVNRSLPLVLDILDSRTTGTPLAYQIDLFDSLTSYKTLGQIDENTRERILKRLEAVSSTLDKIDNRIVKVSAWRAIQALKTKLGVTDDEPIAELLRQSQQEVWVFDELVELARLVRTDARLSAAPIVAQALNAPHTGDMTLLLQGANATELETLLLYATRRLSEPDLSLPLISTIFETGRDDINAVVRQSLPLLLESLCANIESYSSAMTAQAMGTVRKLIDRQPYAMGNREIAQVMDLILRVFLLQKEMAESINICMALFRNRSDTMVQHVTILIDILQAIPPMFRLQKTLAESALVARLLQAMSIMKHVPALLIAYVRIVATTRISRDVRKDLETGLFVVCDIVTAGGRIHSRGREGEAIGEAFGLGEGPGGEAERDVWAELWRSWAAKRYTGQG